MIDLALAFLTRSLNAWLLRRTGSSFGDAIATRVVDDTGRWTIENEHLGASLINIEEERVLRAQVPEPRYVDGRIVTTAPELKLNLHVLLAARFTQYPQALRQLSLAVTFFHAHPSFTRESHPDLDPGLQKLVVEMQTLTFEQLNQVWACLGAKHLPSALYRVRLVALQDVEPVGSGVPVGEVGIDLRTR